MKYVIVASVSNELRDMESKRQKLLFEISSANKKIEELKNEILRKQTDLERVQISLQQVSQNNIKMYPTSQFEFQKFNSI